VETETSISKFMEIALIGDKNTVGIMQPYFFPYIGYFQLIAAVDVYVVLDHVSFMKRSYMVRNTLKNNTTINIPCLGASQNKACTDVFADCTNDWFLKFAKTINLLYKNDPNYNAIVTEILIPWQQEIQRLGRPVSISEFNFVAMYYISEYLDLKPRWYSSGGITTNKKAEGIKDIVKNFKGTDYINAIGGQALYNKEDFEKDNINLHFIKMGDDMPFDNKYASILDLLFRYPKEVIQEQLKNYTLI
jgi:hypothetical protein